MSDEVIVRGGMPGKIRIEIRGQFIEVDHSLSGYSALQEVCPWLAEVLGQPVALVGPEPAPAPEPVAEVVVPEVVVPPPAKLPSLRPSRAPKGDAA